MADYNLQSLYGMRFTAKQNLTKYSDTGRNKIGQIQKGQMVGTLYSYIQRDKEMYFMFYDTFGKPFYIKYIPYSIDSADLQRQGALTALEELQKEKEKNMGAFELFMYKYFWKIIIGFVVLLAVSGLSKNPNAIKRIRYATR